MRQVLAAALLAISATVVPGTDHARAAECQLVPLLSGHSDGVVPPVSDVAVSLAGLPLTMSAGKVLLDGYNSLVPKFDSACGTHLGASILDDRVRLDVANGQDGPSFANLSMDLAPGGGPVGWSIETAFMAADSGPNQALQRHVGARNWMGAFDNRLQAWVDFGLSIDGENELSGHATRYKLAADLWRTEDFKLSGTAGFVLASAGYAVDGIDLGADRAVHEFGGSIDWGRLGFHISHSISTDNTIGDDDQNTRRWRVWSADFKLDLADVHAFVPRGVGFKIEQEHLNRTDIGTLDTAGDLDELSRSLSLELSWDHHGGATTLLLSGSDLDDRANSDTDNDKLDYAIRLTRAFDTGPWELSAEAALTGKGEMSGEQRQRSQNFDLGFNMKSNPGSFGSLGLEAGVSLIDESDRGAPSLHEASARFTYELQF